MKSLGNKSVMTFATICNLVNHLEIKYLYSIIAELLLSNKNKQN